MTIEKLTTREYGGVNDRNVYFNGNEYVSTGDYDPIVLPLQREPLPTNGKSNGNGASPHHGLLLNEIGVEPTLENPQDTPATAPTLTTV